MGNSEWMPDSEFQLRFPTTNTQHISLARPPSRQGTTDVIARNFKSPTPAESPYTTASATMLQRYTGNIRLSFCAENASSNEERATTVVYLKI